MVKFPLGKLYALCSIYLAIAGDLCSSCFQLSLCARSNPWTAVHISLRAMHRKNPMIYSVLIFEGYYESLTRCNSARGHKPYRRYGLPVFANLILKFLM